MGLRGLVAAWIGIAIASSSPLAGADPSEVEALIAKGNELRRAGTPGPALPYFQKAYELARTPRTTGQLGLAELAAGYPVEAVEHLAAALETATDPSIIKYRQMLTDALAQARAQVGELTVEGSPAGAEVVINGRALAALPVTIKLAARTAEVVIRAPGYSPRTEVVPIVGGQRRQVTVNLERVEKPATTAPVVTPAAGPAVAAASSAPRLVDERNRDGGSAGSGLRTTAWIVGGAAVAALGTGLAFNLVTRSDGDYDSWQSDKNRSIVGYASGAALAVASGVLFWASLPSPATSSPRAHLTCTPSHNGLICGSIF